MLLVAQNQVVLTDGTFFRHAIETKESVGTKRNEEQTLNDRAELGLGESRKIQPMIGLSERIGRPFLFRTSVIP